MQRMLVLIVTVLAALGLAACGSSSGSKSSSACTASTGTAVTIDNFTFTTNAVKAGACVTVDNKQSGTTHTVTADNGEFNTGNVAGGSTATFLAPSKPGTYKFHCNIHSTMTATLTVT